MTTENDLVPASIEHINKYQMERLGDEQRLTELHVVNVLRNQRYRSPWAAFHRISDNAIAQRRIVDFLALCTLPSRGIELHGAEIKLSRSDWHGELSRPEKADGWALACHCFYVVAPQGVIVPSEVPDTWGWFELEKQPGQAGPAWILKEKKKAPRRDLGRPVGN